MLASTCLYSLYTWLLSVSVPINGNGFVKEGCIPQDQKSIYKGKGDPVECGSYRGIKLLEHAMKVVEMICEQRSLQCVRRTLLVCECCSKDKVTWAPLTHCGRELRASE